MNLILGLLFRGPFYFQLALAVGLIWFGFFVQNDEANRQAARASLLEQSPPATIAIADAHPGSPSRVPVELSLTAQIAFDHNTRLVTKTYFIETGESHLFVLVDPSPGADPNVARAAIVIEPEDRDAFVAWAVENTSIVGSGEMITTIGGLLVHSSDASHARKAMKNQGMVVADDLFFIEPFFKGRDATLAAIPGKAAQISWPIFCAAAVMALIGLVKLKKATAAKPATPITAPVAERAGIVGRPALQPLAPEKAVRQPKAPMAKSRMFILLVGAAFAAALFAGQSWAYAVLPLGFVGFMFFAMRKGARKVGKQIDAAVDHFGSKSMARDAALTAAVSATPKDRGPIRSGFSFKDMLPQPKQKVAPGLDPFERLAQQRLRQDGNLPGR